MVRGRERWVGNGKKDGEETKHTSQQRTPRSISPLIRGPEIRRIMPFLLKERNRLIFNRSISRGYQPNVSK